MPKTNLQIFPAKNYFLNGGIELAQKIGNGNAVSLPVGFGVVNDITYYAVDRFQVYYNGSFSGTPQTSQTFAGFGPPDGLSDFSLNTNGVPTASNAKMVASQKIESTSAAELANTSASIGFWVQSYGVDSRIQVQLYYPGAKDDYSSSTLFHTSSFIPLATMDGWIYVEINNISMPAQVSKGIAVLFTVDNFASFNISSGFYISEFMLNKGSKALPFTRARGTYAAELEECQRFFEKSNDLASPIGATGGNGEFLHRPTTNTFGEWGTAKYKVRKRFVTPYVYVWSNVSGTFNKVRNYTAGADDNATVVAFAEYSYSGFSGTSVTQYELYGWQWYANAEIP